MKNLKALEILKEHKYSLECLVRNDVVSHLLKQTNEAIMELEALENRSCSNCKKRPSPFSECPCWSYSFGKANISLCSEWEAKK